MTLPVCASIFAGDPKLIGREVRVGGPSKHRILIADDNPDVIEAFEIMLQMLGHEVETAHDGMEASKKRSDSCPT